MQNRPLYIIAADIKADWQKVNYAAVPYLEAMQQLNSIDDNFILDSARSIVRYFLSNARSWHGEKARKIKAELNAMV